MKRILCVFVLMMGLTLVLSACKNHEHKNDADSETSLGAEKADMAMNDVYQCPMDCEEGKTYEEEGKCPVCGMDLKKVEGKEEGTDTDKDQDHDDHEGHDHD